jgi:outer membrane protein TolC
MTLEDAVEHARVHNPALTGAYERWKAAENVEGEIGWVPDPVLALGYKRGGWMPDESMRMLMVDQRIPFPTKTSGRKSKAELMASAEQARYGSQARKTVKAVKVAYIDLLLVDATIDIYEEDLEDALAVMESAKQRYETGAAPYHDLSSSRVDALLTENDLKTLRDGDRVKAAAALKAVLGMAEHEALGEMSVPEVPIMDVKLESLEVFDVSLSPELDEQRYMMESVGEDLSLARQRYIPDLKLRYWTERKESGMGEISTDGFMVFFNVPLWFWNTEAAKDVRSHRHVAAESMLRAQSDVVARDLETAVAAFASTRNRLDLVENRIIPEAEVSYVSAVTAYENGTIELVSLAGAKDVLRNAKLSRVRLWAKAAKELAEIERLTGLSFY